MTAAAADNRGSRFSASHIAAVAVIVVMAAWPGAIASSESFLLYVGTLVVLYSVGAMSLHLVFRMGQVSFAHAAFLGIGGYTSALLLTGSGLSWPLAFCASGLVSGLFGLLLGPIVLRLRGVYFVLFTFILCEFAERVFTDWGSLTNGAGGVAGIPAPPAFSSPVSFYYLCLGVAVLCALICRGVLKSDVGEAIDAIRTSESLAESNGVPVFRIKVAIFAISCLLVGFQGALQASFVHYISPASYTFDESLRFVVMNVIGGMNSLWGPVLGSVFIIALPELLRNWVEYQWVLYGVVLVLAMRYLPGGLYELGERASALLRKGGA
jgi:branched-chain amino acid transport system permease protein